MGAGLLDGAFWPKVKRRVGPQDEFLAQDVWVSSIAHRSFRIPATGVRRHGRADVRELRVAVAGYVLQG